MPDLALLEPPAPRSAAVNRLLDALPRETIAAAGGRPAFLVCGIAGYHSALLVLVAGALLRELDLLVCGVLAAVCAASFFAWARLRRWVTGRETLVLLEHLWVAELCAAGTLVALGEPLLAYLDVVAVALCFFLAAGRIGCTLAGCCHGRESSVGIRYADGPRRFPVQPLEAAGLLGIGAAGLLALAITAPMGAVLTWVLLAYAILRFGLEGLRGDRRPHVLGWSVNRWMCVAEGLVAVTIASRPLDERDALLGGGLAAVLAITLALRSRNDPLLAPEHVAELSSAAQAAAARAGEDPLLVRTSRGVALVCSRDGELHASLSVPGRAADRQLLWALAAQALPNLRQATLAGGVLHLRE